MRINFMFRTFHLNNISKLLNCAGHGETTSIAIHEPLSYVNVFQNVVGIHKVFEPNFDFYFYILFEFRFML